MGQFLRTETQCAITNDQRVYSKLRTKKLQ